MACLQVVREEGVERSSDRADEESRERAEAAQARRGHGERSFKADTRGKLGTLK